MVGSNYKFVAIDIGSFGKELVVFFKNQAVTYVILGDQAFRLHRHILKLYSQNLIFKKLFLIID